MSGPHRSGPTPTDPAGASQPWRASRGYLGLAVALVAGSLTFLALSYSAPRPVAVDTTTQAPLAGPPPRATSVAPARLEAAPSAATAPAAAPASAVARAPASAPQVPRMRDPDGDQTPDLADYVNSGERPTMAEVIERLHQAGEHGGLGAFSPPGTRPPLLGLAVPEDFVLPDGYVRHYQATDDGQRLEAILMFAPDRRLVDASGQPIPIPKDRVVPPELAPPGLPLRRIVIPAPIEPGK